MQTKTTSLDCMKLNMYSGRWIPLKCSIRSALFDVERRRILRTPASQKNWSLYRISIYSLIVGDYVGWVFRQHLGHPKRQCTRWEEGPSASNNKRTLEPTQIITSQVCTIIKANQDSGTSRFLTFKPRIVCDWWVSGLVSLACNSTSS